MKLKQKFIICSFTIAVIFFISCKKNNTSFLNHIPTANAGPDQNILLPANTAELDGRNSTDPDNNITSYKWKKIGGSSSFNITHTDSIKTTVDELGPGVYQFELKVTDAGGLFAKDTVLITVDATVPNNQPPVADAGQDQAITLPNNIVTVDGSLSADPDNNITAYQWSKISGPSSFNIENTNDIQTQVTSLIEGVYQFELKVRDAGGLVESDTCQIIVNAPAVNAWCDNRSIIKARVVPIGVLSEKRMALVSATTGGKILFAGGMTTSAYSSRVDIYDLATNTWSTAELTQPARQGMVAATVGNKILFAGGGDNDNGGTTSRVDIYDASNNTWSIAELSKEREFLAAATLGDKVFFAGGRSWESTASGYYTWATSKVVDVFDNATNTWTTATLSESRSDLSATTAGNKIFFSGGFLGPFQQFPSKTIDVYDSATNSWSTSLLQEEKAAHAGIVAGNKIFWAGGIFNNNGLGPWPSNHVEIQDINTGVISFACFIPKTNFNAVIRNDNIIFFPGSIGGGQVSGSQFDIYNTTTNQWSTGELNRELYDAAIISVNNTIYLAGGRDQAWGPYFNNVWKLEF